ncbi:T9SS type A sorting domain-containing protein [Fibrella sp. HMF5335]|uniref:Aminopeptidase N n=1 Tax=Fibrella rubiginis TaxID=2817060 RepID=A0A939K4V5_9BACT|nr:M1 family aminopeptidase [Fibrella rubiginis]MBO0936596.1 T9SS type A sorting domain-containing protein [Fibrella rubiginis]
MKNSFFILVFNLLCIRAMAQTGGEVCAQGKTRFFGQPGRFSPQQARLAPDIQSAGDASIDVTYYGLNLNLTYIPSYLRGVATVAVKPATTSLSSFFLDLNSALRVDSVKVGNGRLAFSHANNRLTITLPQTLAVGQTQRLLVYYQGLPVSADGAFAFTTHDNTKDPLIYSLSEPYGASDWFPCKDTPADKADSSAVSITAPPTFVSVSNGLLQRVINNIDGTKTYFWKNSYPIAQYLISIACTNYTQYDTPLTYQGQTMPVTHYIFPEDLAAAKPIIDQTNDMIRVFSDRFGIYPFIREKYGHAEFGKNQGGMEHQTVSSMDHNALLDRNVVSHELMHQWFGDKITCRDWQNIWLNEGFASYGEAIYQESLGGKAAYQSYMNTTFASRAKAATGTVYAQNVGSVNAIFDYNRTYCKGAWVLHMLRGVLGDSTFFKGMKAYVASPAAYSTAITEDYQRVMEQASGKDLNYFFKEWIYGEKYPVYTYSVAPIANTNQAILRISQAASTNPTSFTMPIQVTVQSAGGSQLVTVVNDQPVQSFTIAGSGPITGIAFDPDNWILKTATQVDPPVNTTPVVLATESTRNSLEVYPNPSHDQLTVTFSTQTAGPITLSLVNTLGQTVSSQSEVNVLAGSQKRILPLRQLAAGAYILRLQTVDGAQRAGILVK